MHSLLSSISSFQGGKNTVTPNLEGLDNATGHVWIELSGKALLEALREFLTHRSGLCSEICLLLLHDNV